MRIRKFTPVAYFDLAFGCLIPTLFVIPRLIQVMSVSRTHLFTSSFVVTFICVISIIAMATLWIVVLKGSEQTKQEKTFCRFAITMAAIGIIIQTLHFLIFDFKIQFVISFFQKLTDLSNSQEVFKNSGILFLTGMIGAFFVGLKYLILLLKPFKTD